MWTGSYILGTKVSGFSALSRSTSTCDQQSGEPGVKSPTLALMKTHHLLPSRPTSGEQYSTYILVFHSVFFSCCTHPFQPAGGAKHPVIVSGRVVGFLTDKEQH